MASVSVEKSTYLREETYRGEVYHIDKTTGEKFIKGSRRPDGTVRKDIKVRPGYMPREEQRPYVPKPQLKPPTTEPKVPGWDDELEPLNEIKKKPVASKPKETKKKKPTDCFEIIEGLEAIKLVKEGKDSPKKFNQSPIRHNNNKKPQTAKVKKTRST